MLRLGGDETVMLGLGVTFSPENAAFLLDLLPPFLLVPRPSATAGAVATILALLDGETERAAMGGEVVTARLAEVLLIEAIRAHASGADAVALKWLGALADPRIGRALHAVHADIARSWTVASLAGKAGMSRAAFAAEFTCRLGHPPLAYVRTWRLTIARAALAHGHSDIGTVAAKTGYASQSAFSYAYRRAFGTSPKMDRKIE